MRTTSIIAALVAAFVSQRAAADMSDLPDSLDDLQDLADNLPIGDGVQDCLDCLADPSSDCAEVCVGAIDIDDSQSGDDDACTSCNWFNCVEIPCTVDPTNAPKDGPATKPVRATKPGQADDLFTTETVTRRYTRPVDVTRRSQWT
eukprot:INCI15210.3.p1 GENE.INCI15210.3~~INCI15210.3.p1  ORF type:complete len:146 (+),score=24.83 INCI15210.3:264-701(+)